MKPKSAFQFIIALNIALSSFQNFSHGQETPDLEIVDKKDFAEINRLLRLVKEKCVNVSGCPEVNVQRAKQLAEAIVKTQYVLEVYNQKNDPAWLANGKKLAWQHYQQVFRELSIKERKTAEMEKYHAYQKFFHDVSELFSDFTEVTSFLRDMKMNSRFSDQLTEAIEKGTITKAQYAVILNNESGAINQLLAKTNDIAQLTEALKSRYDAVKKGVTENEGGRVDSPGSSDFDNIRKIGQSIYDTYNQISDLISKQKELLAGMGPWKIDDIKKLRSSVGVSAAQLILTPLQLISGRLLQEMEERINEQHKLISSEQANLSSAFNQWQEYNATEELVVNTLNEIRSTLNVFYFTMRNYLGRQSFGFDPVPDPRSGTAREGLNLLNQQLRAKINILKQCVNNFVITQYAVKPNIKLSKNQFLPNEEVTITFNALPCFADDAWIGIVPSNIAHGNESLSDQSKISNKHLGKKSSGTLKFKIPGKAGSYDFRMFDSEENGKEIISVTFTVKEKADVVELKDRTKGLLIVHTEISGCSGRDTITEFKIFQNENFVTSSSAPNQTDLTYALKPPPYHFELKPGIYDLKMNGMFLPINTKIKIEAGKKTTWSRGENTGKLEIHLRDRSGNPKKFSNYKIVIADSTKELFSNYWWSATDHDAGSLPVGNYEVTVSFSVPEPYHQETQTRKVNITSCKTTVLNFYDNGKVTEDRDDANIIDESKGSVIAATEENLKRDQFIGEWMWNGSYSKDVATFKASGEIFVSDSQNPIPRYYTIWSSREDSVFFESPGAIYKGKIINPNTIEGTSEIPGVETGKFAMTKVNQTNMYKAKWQVTFEYTVGTKQSGKFYALLKENGKWDFSWKESGQIDFKDFGDWKLTGDFLVLDWKEPNCCYGTYDGVITDNTIPAGSMTSSQGYMGRWTAKKIE